MDAEERMNELANYACNHFTELLNRGSIHCAEDTTIRILMNSKKDILIVNNDENRIPYDYRNGCGFNLNVYLGWFHFSLYYISGQVWNEEKGCWEPATIVKEEKVPDSEIEEATKYLLDHEGELLWI